MPIGWIRTILNMKIAILNHEDNDVNLLNVLNTVGHTVISLNDMKELQHEQFDLLIADNDSSDNVIKLIASAKEKCAAILFIANHASEAQIVAALNAGAADYLIMPIRPNELLARIEVMLQRVYPEQAALDNVAFGRYIFEKRFGRVSLSGQFIELTRKEFDLALLLFNHVGKPLSRATMLDAVWVSESDIPSRTLDTHISRVRTKLQLRPENGFRLVPVYSFGYCLEPI